MTTTFNRAFEIVIGHEGGFTDNAHDPGNWTGGIPGVGTLKGTKFGISAKSFAHLDIPNLTLDDARKIYRGHYWDQINADDLSPPLALLAFDAAVNNGVGRAKAWLAKSNNADTERACVEFMAQRLWFFMVSIPDEKTKLFGLGWSRRLARLPYEAMKMEDARA